MIIPPSSTKTHFTKGFKNFPGLLKWSLFRGTNPVVRFRRRRFGLINRLRIDERLVGSWINSLAYQLLTQCVCTYCLRGDGGGE
ncbi:hypothetical protein NC652_009924 [Populus alba x Populus x berolinensis]|nr:hypothetical protein NC652_009924 [Populus alba x Populus x berolinensis]